MEQENHTLFTGLVNRFNYMGQLISHAIEEKGCISAECRAEMFRNHVEIISLFRGRVDELESLLKRKEIQLKYLLEDKGKMVFDKYIIRDDYILTFYESLYSIFYSIEYKETEEIEIIPMFVIRCVIEYLELSVSCGLSYSGRICAIIEDLIDITTTTPMFNKAVNGAIEKVNETKFGSTLSSSDNVFHYTSAMITLTKTIGMLSSSSIGLDDYTSLNILYRILTQGGCKLNLESMKTLDFNIHKYHKEFGGKEDYHSTQRIRFLTGIY